MRKDTKISDNSRNIQKSSGNRKKKKSNFRVLLFLIIGYIVFSFSRNAIALWNLNSQENEVKAHTAKLVQENLALQKKVKKLSSNSFVEEMARKKLGLIKPDELLFVVTKPGKQTASPSQNSRGVEITD